MEELINRSALLAEFEWLKSVVNESSKDEVEETIQRIRNAPTINAVSKGLFDQVRWERDVALEQLADLGLGLGQKIEGYYITEDEYDKLLEYKYMYEDLCR